MPETRTADPEVAEQVNRLYWSSELTVDEVLSELGIGRSTLYSSIRPQPAGASCPICGTRLVFMNRSRRSSGSAVCPGCATEVNLAEMQESDAPERGEPLAPLESDRPDDRGRSGRWTEWRHDLAAVAPERAAMIGGAAALGVVLGAVATRAARDLW